MIVNDTRLGNIWLLVLIGWVWLAGTTSAFAAEVDYLRQIKPLLKDRCFACHGGLKQNGGLRLDTVENMTRGGDSGAAIVPGDAAASLLIQAVRGEGNVSRMPPAGEAAALSPEQIDLISRWITSGAKRPAQECPEVDPREHWAFRRPVRPVPPQTSVLAANPIDQFLARAQSKRNLQPVPEAAPEILLRRVHLDLTGLPPSAEQVRDFLADPSEDSYMRVVNQLLDSPEYGERWARHWMDVWRYSDWYGRRNVPDWWNSACQIWRWRDWIVTSLNEDRGYDVMIQEMLAGDELAGDQDDRVVATGFLARNWYALNYNAWMRDNIEHTSKAFLGLTFNCAHCHDHKYDPISHVDYFRFRAFFEPLEMRQDRWPGEPDPGPFQKYNYSTLRKVVPYGSIRVFDERLDAPTLMYAGGDERNKLVDRGPVSPGFPSFLDDGEIKIELVKLPAQAWYPALRPAILQTLVTDANAAVTASTAAVVAANSSGAEPSVVALEQLAQAKAAYERAVSEADNTGMAKALSGRQSLLMDATTGRRILQNRLPGLKELPDGSRLEFQLQIAIDAHVNFQFAKDLVAGLTAGYVGFNRGRIISYQPSTFTEFDAGRYDFDAGQHRFQVTLVLDRPQDRCRLSVRSLSDDQLLIDAVPVALNGWNPIGDSKKGFSFDAQTGSVAIIDDVKLLPPASNGDVSLFACDFEPPLYLDGKDAVGIGHWEASSFGVAPASSVVLAVPVVNPALRAAQQKLLAAHRAVDLPMLKLRAAESAQLAAEAQWTSLNARIQAERTRYGELPNEDAAALVRQASLREREAQLRQAESDLLSKELSLAQAESKPIDDTTRAKDIEAAHTAIAAARTAVDAAQRSLADESLLETYAPLSPKYPTQSTGRRSALARWISSSRNPLTARVAVNHLWLRHFGQTFVDSVFDFGRNGKPPSHPELLDWLAVEFMESGWSQKHLHRLIVSSRIYRQSSATNGVAAIHNRTIDPDNQLYWRYPARRLEAEAIRDALVKVCGKLDLRLGGKEIEADQDGKIFRRSLYYSSHPEDGGRLALLENFDVPDTCDCYRRSESILPQQALALTNSPLSRSLSQSLSSQLWKSVTESITREVRESLIRTAFEHVLARGPTENEAAVAQDFWTKLADSSIQAGTDPTAAEPAAFESLIHSLLNHHDFVTIR